MCSPGLKNGKDAAEKGSVGVSLSPPACPALAKGWPWGRWAPSLPCSAEEARTMRAGDANGLGR